MFAGIARQWLHLLLVAVVALTGVLTALPPRTVYATENQNNDWQIEIWSEQKWTPPSGVIIYRAEATRLGPAISSARFGDSRGAGTSGYGAISPPPASGGGSSGEIVWNLPLMNPGDTWTARYEVQVRPDVAVGTKITSWVMVLYGSAHAVSSHDDVWLAETPTAGPQWDHLSGDTNVITWNDPWNSTSGANSYFQDTGDPLNAGTGEHYLAPPPDFDLGGPLPLAFSRYYASGLQVEGMVASALGANWMHNFDLRLAGSGWERIVVYERGKLIYFQYVWGQPGVTWALNFHQEPVPFQLRQDKAGHFWLMDPVRELVYRFDGNGLLQDIQDRNGNRLTVSRDGAGRITQIADGLGRALTFTYDAAGRLTRVADGARHVDFTYDASGHLATFTDATGQQTTYTYAADLSRGPLLTAQTPPRGNTPYAQTYNAKGQVIRQVDAYGNATTIAYDTPASGQTRVIRPDGSTLVFTHEDRRLGTAVQDPAGNTITMDFDDRERLTALHDRLGDTTRVTYHDASGKIASYTDAAGYTTTFTYAAQSQTFTNPVNSETVNFTFYNLTRITYADGTHDDLGYDARGNVISYTDRLGKVWSYTYNGQGLVLTQTNPQGGVTTYTYHADGTRASMTNSDSGTTTYTYDGLKRLAAVTRPDGSTAHFTYDLNDRVLTDTDERGKATSFTYDANGNLATLSNPLTQATAHAHDLMDRLSGYTDPLGYSSVYAYNALGQLASITDRNGHTISYTYNSRGWLTGVTDPAGQTWTYAYDDEGVPAAFATPLGHTTAFQTNKLGYTTAITDPLGAVTRFSYDALRRLTSITDRLGLTPSYTYDAEGRLTGVTQPLLGTAAYSRNALGRLTRISDMRDRRWDFTYTTMGRLSSHTDPLGNQWTYAYDNRGRLWQITYPGGHGTATFTYDAASRRTRISYPGGLSLNYTYNDIGQILTADTLALTYDARGDISNSQEGAASFGATYDQGGRLVTVTYDGEATVTYTYDARNLLTRVEDSLSGAWMTFSHDSDGRLTGITRSNSVNTTYTRDNAGRVTRIQDVGAQGLAPLQADQQYTLNAEGEPTQVVRTLPLDVLLQTGAADLTYDDANQISSSGYAYDARGRQTAAPGKSYTYDGANRLTQVTASDSAATFTYNGMGDLRTRTVGVVATTFYHNYALGLAPIVAEATETRGQGDTETRRVSPSPLFSLSLSQYRRFYVYTPGGALLYSMDPATSQVHFYHFDRGGSTLFLTDSGGAVSDAYAYDPYGNLLGHTGSSDQPFTYVGRYSVCWEPVGNLYHMHARTYDPATARFLTRDPVWPTPGSLQRLNPYQYAAQNPLRYVDPRGTMPERPDLMDGDLFDAWGEDSGWPDEGFGPEADPEWFDETTPYLEEGTADMMEVGGLPIDYPEPVEGFPGQYPPPTINQWFDSYFYDYKRANWDDKSQRKRLMKEYGLSEWKLWKQLCWRAAMEAWDKAGPANARPDQIYGFVVWSINSTVPQYNEEVQQEGIGGLFGGLFGGGD